MFMRTVIGCLAVGLGSTAHAQAQEPPPVPLVIHPRTPDSITQEMVYHCEDGERRIVVRRAQPNGPIEFLSGTRQGLTLPAAETERATRALRQLDTLWFFSPSCAPQFDSILALGLLNLRTAVVYLVWVDNRLQTSPPEWISLAQPHPGTERR
jgi:hypothetical protein